MKWNHKKVHHNTCVHLVRQNDGSWRECGVTILEYDGRPQAWLCPMHERQVMASLMKAKIEQARLCSPELLATLVS